MHQGLFKQQRRKRRGSVEDEIEHEETTSTHILSNDPIMVKETETETEKRDEGGMTYRPLNMLTVVLLSGHFAVIAGNEGEVGSQECLFGIIFRSSESAHIALL